MTRSTTEPPRCCGELMYELTTRDGWWCPDCGRMEEREREAESERPGPDLPDEP